MSCIGARSRERIRKRGRQRESKGVMRIEDVWREREKTRGDRLFVALTVRVFMLCFVCCGDLGGVWRAACRRAVMCPCGYPCLICVSSRIVLASCACDRVEIGASRVFCLSGASHGQIVGGSRCSVCRSGSFALEKIINCTPTIYNSHRSPDSLGTHLKPS